LRSGKPAILTWFSAFCLVLGITCLLRFQYTLQPPPAALALPPWYLPLSGLLWGAALLFAAIALWIPRHWVPAVIRGISGGFVLWLWGERFLLVQSTAAQRSAPFILVSTLVLYASTWFVFALRRVQQFYRGM